MSLLESRVIDAGTFDIVAAPGYPRAPNGCSYTPEDLVALTKVAGGHLRPMVLLMHAPPDGRGPDAVDWNGGDNTGDPAIRRLLDALYPNVGLYAHADDAGGRMLRAWLNVGSIARGMAMRIDLVNGLPQRRALSLQ